MKKDFKKELKALNIPNILDQFTNIDIKGHEYTILVPESTLKAYMWIWTCYSFEQFIKPKDDIPNATTTCFVLNSNEFKKIIYIDVKLINYKNKALLLSFRWRDKFWPFNFELLLASFNNFDHFKQLVHLYNQDYISIHMYDDWEFKKHFKINNPLKDNEDLRMLLERIDDSGIEDMGEEHDFNQEFEMVNSFYAKYPSNHIYYLHDRNDSYIYLD